MSILSWPNVNVTCSLQMRLEFGLPCTREVREEERDKLLWMAASSVVERHGMRDVECGTALLLCDEQ